MPHLDEGALWVRATAPYTISFEEASKLSPQIRDILRSFPQVTTVANELGRPDDGTDSTGFFNNEFYVGLKPYERSRVEGIDSQQDGIDRGDSAENCRRFPASFSTTRNRPKTRWTKPKPVSRALLAVKIFGGDLATLEDKAKQVKNVIAKVPGITDITVVRELGQPSLIDHSRPRQNRALRPECERRQHPG